MRTPSRTGIALAAATLLATGLTALGSADASTSSRPDPGALPQKLTPAQRAGLLADADAAKAGTAKALKLGADEKLIVRDVLRDRDGTVHTRYERTYAGLPVLGGDLVVHEKPDGARSVTRDVPGSVAVPSTKAATAPGGDSRKVVWAAAGKPVLAWETVERSTKADGTPSELHVITDAGSGRRLYAYDAVHTGVGESEYSGTVTIDTTPAGGGFELTDRARGGHSTFDLAHGTKGQGTLFTDPDDHWGDGTPADPQTAAVDAQYGAAATWDYYKDVHGRVGIRNDGVGAYSRVHYGVAYVNAFWQDSCFCMTYGDGEGDARPLTALDVAGHEMSHGVTAATAGLIYSRESGGLNEATSDIFGTAVEFHADNASDPGDYLIGEKIDIFGNGRPLRFMDQPSKDGRGSADYWTPKLGKLDVHFSSGVANHFFYLLAEGSGVKTINGVTYDSPTVDGQPVTGIGRADAEQIWYRALTVYMTRRTDYADARVDTVRAAGDLFGVGSTEQQAVERAWSAVDVH